MALLDKSFMGNGDGLDRVKVDVNEWQQGAHVYVRMLRGDELNVVQDINTQIGNTGDDVNAELSAVAFCISCVCDDSGKSVFEVSDKDMLLHGPLAPLVRCGETAARINGFSQDAQEDIEKKS